MSITHFSFQADGSLPPVTQPHPRSPLTNLAQLAQAKVAARARARLYRDALTPQQREAFSRAICVHARDLLARLPGRTDRYGRSARGVGLYSPIGSEVDTRPLQLMLTRQCYPFALPTVMGMPQDGAAAMGFTMVDAHTPLTLSRHGIAEPHSALGVDPGCHHRLMALFVPCLAFSQQGVRLGYGRGYFDRLLAHFGGHIIGLAYAGQRDDTLRAADHDVALHAVITEDGLVMPPGSPLQTSLPPATSH